MRIAHIISPCIDRHSTFVTAVGIHSLAHSVMAFLKASIENAVALHLQRSGCSSHLSLRAAEASPLSYKKGGLSLTGCSRVKSIAFKLRASGECNLV